MKKYTLLLGFLCSTLLVSAQLNMSLLSNLSFGRDCNDIWGYVAPDGTEYAVIGTQDGVGIVDLSDPANPLLRDYITGSSSNWRDLKSFGEYIYVVADEGNDGLLIIDMTDHDQMTALPFVNWKPSLTINGTTANLSTAHNIYIDENGVAYIAGSTLNEGGMLFIDVATNPMNPSYLGAGPAVYSHDVFVRGDTMWSADISEGYFSVVDITDKSNPVIMATQPTPFLFTHNVWLSDDGNTLYTTDETANAPVAAYDVSDLSNIQLLDEFRPLETLGDGVIPHNTHVKGDYLVISYYSDGVIVVDVSDPSNMVEVGNYDTYFGQGAGFNGAWGAYPFLPSGLVLVSDIADGLYVFEPNYIEAAYLEGMVTDNDSGLAIDGVDIEIAATPVTASSDFAGNYKTGYAESGTFDVTFKKATYAPQTVSVTLTNGQTTLQDVALVPLTPFVFTGQLRDMDSGNPISNGLLRIYNSELSYDVTTDGAGNFTLPTFYQDSYSILAGKWGYKEKEVVNLAITPSNNTLTINLEKGIQDGFGLDLGWTVSGDAVKGHWEIGQPIPIQAPIPSADVTVDFGRTCYLTENTADPQTGNVNGGTTSLASPIFDLTGYTDPHIGYFSYFFSVNLDNGFPPVLGDDSLRVYLTNGTDMTMINIFPTASFPVGWTNTTYRVLDTMALTSTMQIIFEASDLPTSVADITESGVDFFRVTDEPTTGIKNITEKTFLSVAPNPFQGAITVEHLKTTSEEMTFLEVYNGLGQLVEQINLNNRASTLEIGHNWEPGIYFIQWVGAETRGKAMKVVKSL